MEKGLFENRVVFLMNYRPDKLLSEQRFIPGIPSAVPEPVEKELGPNEVDVKKHRQIEGYKTILAPNGYAYYIPEDAEVTRTSNSNTTWQNFKFFRDWKGTKWDSWIPYNDDDIRRMEKPNSVIEFKLDNGKTYRARYMNPNFKSEDSKPSPSTWKFAGYETKDGELYVPPKSQNNWVFDWIMDNSETISVIGAQIVVAVLTQGMSLTAQAWALLGVDVAVFLKELFVDKDSLGAVIGLLVGFIPVAGRIAKFGVANPIKFLKTHGSALSRIRNHTGFKNFYTLLDDEEKILIRRAIEQVPAEAKKFTNKNIAIIMKNALNDATIDWKKIPFKQMLWWKQLFVESGLQIGTQMALEIAFREKNFSPEQEEKLQKAFDKEIKTKPETTNVLDSLENIQRSGGYFREIK